MLVEKSVTMRPSKIFLTSKTAHLGRPEGFSPLEHRHQTGQYRKLTDASKSGCFSFRNYALAVSKSYSFFPSYT